MPPRDRASDDPAPEATSAQKAAAPARKGRPTPKRKEAEQAHRRPLVPDSGGDRSARKAKAKARRELEYKAMMTGDDRHLPLRDRGPVRRWVRDYVDARHNPSEYFLPVSLVIVVASLFTTDSPLLALILIGLLYLVLFVTITDAVLLNARIRKRLVAKFGEEKIPRGIRMYGTMRAFQMRRTRLPRPQVKRGEYPR